MWRIFLYASSPPAIERLSSGLFQEVIITNTIPISEKNYFPQLTILSVANLLGETIWRVHDDCSVSSIFQWTSVFIHELMNSWTFSASFMNSWISWIMLIVYFLYHVYAAINNTKDIFSAMPFVCHFANCICLCFKRLFFRLDLNLTRAWGLINSSEKFLLSSYT